MNSGSLTPSRYTNSVLCHLESMHQVYLLGATYIPGSILGTGGTTQSPFQWSFIPEPRRSASRSPLGLARGWPKQDWQLKG